MINHAATGWDSMHRASALVPGTMVPYIPGGLDSNKAEVLGFTREGEQIVLMFRHYVVDKDTGKDVLTQRIFQRDRYTVEGLYKDAQRAG